MSFYDEAISTGDFQWLDDLIKGKAHVKAHFRKDPTTGKMIFVKEHEKEIHQVHVVFAKGDKVKVLHGTLAGKEGTVKGYSEDKHVLRLDVEGYPNIAITPHKVEHFEKTHENTPGEVEKPESEEDPLNEVKKIAEAEPKPAEQEPTSEPTVESKEPEQEEPTFAALSPSQILNTAKTGSDAFYNLSSDQIKAKVKEWKDWFEIKDVYISNAIAPYLPEQPMELLATKALALTEMGKYAEAKKLFDAMLVKKKQWDEFYGDKDPEPLTIDQHQAFMKKLYGGEANIGELKQAFQQFVASKDSIQKELEAKTVKELSEYSFTHAKNKAAMVKQILHSMMDKYVPGGGLLWSPFTETYEEAVQKHINRMTDEDIQNVAGKIKAKKEFHAKATTNPETIEEYKHFIRHQGEDFIDPWMEEQFESLKKQKADLEAAEKAKIPPKIETKEVGFHGHFLADKKGIKVFANHEEVKAEAEKLQGHGFNAHPIGGIVKISNKGEGPPKLSDASVKKVKVGKDTWYANDKGMAYGFEDEDEALVTAHKLQALGHNAVPSGKGIIFKDSNEAPKIDFTYHETIHTKHGHPLFVAKLTEKVDKPTYSNLLSQAKKFGGYYSSYSQGGAVPGFTFKDKAKAQQFMAEAKGEEYKPEAVTSSSGPKSMGHGDVQMILAVHTISLDDPAMGHEIMRINTMSDKALEARIYKIKDDQKLHNFWQALAHKNKVHLAAKAMEELKARADVKLWGK